ncbi:hypothetical protein Hanom_Chr14g01270331 [Helianthus anomalus]
MAYCINFPQLLGTSFLQFSPLLRIRYVNLVPFEETLCGLELLENINTFDHLFGLLGALIGQERDNVCVIWSHFGCGYFD